MSTVLTATAQEIAQHPLATFTGQAIASEALKGQQVWLQCTKPQRALLDRLCPETVEELKAVGRMDAARLPLLPVSLHPAMHAALIRRGLADGYRLTARAIHAWYWHQWMERPR